MADGITTVEEAFAAAKLEHANAGAAPEGVGAPPAPPAADSPPPDSDQPSEADPAAQALIDSLVEQPVEEPQGLEMNNPRFWTQSHEIDGEPVTLAEMRDGYLRRKDYTQKTQALAEQRKSAESAIKFYENFEADPMEFARAMAVEYGWLDQSSTAPVKNIEIPKGLQGEELDARLEEMLEERISADPRVLTAQQIEAQQLIADEFDRIEHDLKVTLPDELRNSLLVEADERQVYDLELLLKARMSGVANRQRPADNVLLGGGARPTGPGGPAPAGNGTQPPAPPQTVEEAWAQAKAEAAAQGA